MRSRAIAPLHRDLCRGALPRGVLRRRIDFLRLPHHRFSHDLDVFDNDDDRFGLWAQRIIQALARSGEWAVTSCSRSGADYRRAAESTA